MACVPSAPIMRATRIAAAGRLHPWPLLIRPLREMIVSHFLSVFHCLLDNDAGQLAGIEVPMIWTICAQHENVPLCGGSAVIDSRQHSYGDGGLLSRHSGP